MALFIVRMPSLDSARCSSEKGCNHDLLMAGWRLLGRVSDLLARNRARLEANRQTVCPTIVRASRDRRARVGVPPVADGWNQQRSTYTRSNGAGSRRTRLRGGNRVGGLGAAVLREELGNADVGARGTGACDD